MSSNRLCPNYFRLATFRMYSAWFYLFIQSFTHMSFLLFKKQHIHAERVVTKCNFIWEYQENLNRRGNVLSESFRRMVFEMDKIILGPRDIKCIIREALNRRHCFKKEYIFCELILGTYSRYWTVWGWETQGERLWSTWDVF